MNRGSVKLTLQRTMRVLHLKTKHKILNRFCFVSLEDADDTWTVVSTFMKLYPKKDPQSISWTHFVFRLQTFCKLQKSTDSSEIHMSILSWFQKNKLQFSVTWNRVCISKVNFNNCYIWNIFWQLASRFETIKNYTVRFRVP